MDNIALSDVGSRVAQGPFKSQKSAASDGESVLGSFLKLPICSDCCPALELPGRTRRSTRRKGWDKSMGERTENKERAQGRTRSFRVVLLANMPAAEEEKARYTWHACR